MTKAVRILHLSTHNENCGIGKYQEMFLAEMIQSNEVENEFFEISPNILKTLPSRLYKNAFKKLEEKLKDYDILHIQHEFSFYWRDEVRRAVHIAKRLNKKVIVTIHTAPNVAHRKPVLTGIGPRSLIRYARSLLSEKRFFYRLINPLKNADLILVHNQVTKKSLIERGVPEVLIQKIVIPVPKITANKASRIIKDNLLVQKGDIVLGTVGFLHRFKGIDAAIKSLNLLPKNYKLAIVGGVHPGTDDPGIYDKLTDLIVKYKVQDRVFITGYVQDDNDLNAYIRECDICVYPYDRDYYSNVSSAALNNAFANGVAVVGYPTASFKELNEKTEYLRLTNAFSYYELAHSIKNIDVSEYSKRSTDFALHYSYSSVSKELVRIYVNLITIS